MGTIRIEPDPSVKEERCEACGGTSLLLHGYIYDDEYAHGVYFLEWCDKAHAPRVAFLTLGLGAFGDGTEAADRKAFCVEWRAEGMRLTEEPVRDRPELLGEFVPRAAALNLSNIEHLWHIADHIVLDDPRIAAVESWMKAS